MIRLDSVTLFPTLCAAPSSRWAISTAFIWAIRPWWRSAALGQGRGRPCIVATFDPHPVEFFAPGSPPFRLSTLDQRQEWFGRAGADAMLVFAFDAAMAASSAHDWVHEVLGRQLGAAGVVTGEDFTFGKGRSGSVATLREMGAEIGLGARAVVR
jgi:riboflavin kinase/FMN adenylyltransferase